MLAGNGAKVNCFVWRKGEKKAGLKISSYIPDETVTLCCHIYDAPVYGLCAPFFNDIYLLADRLRRQNDFQVI